MTSAIVFKAQGEMEMITIAQDAHALVDHINRGNWKQYFPKEKGPLIASLQGDVVIITPQADKSIVPRVPSRELQVLRMWCAGKTPQEIACELGLKARTVRGHIANLRMRLNVDNNQHLVMKAIHFGLVRPQG